MPYESHHNTPYQELLNDYNKLRDHRKEELKKVEMETREKMIKPLISTYKDLSYGIKAKVDGLREIRDKLRKEIENVGITVIDKDYIHKNYNDVFSTDCMDAVDSANFVFIVMYGRSMVDKVLEDGFYDNVNNKVIEFAKVRVVN